MKRFSILILLFCSVGVFAQSKNENSAVAVLEFQKTGAITSDDVQTLTNRFRAMLFQTKTFNVVERQKMKEILKEQEFILSDECSTNECAVQVGQLLGVEYMIAGDIGLIGDTYTIDLRMIEVRTGQLVQTHSKDYDGKIAGLLEIMKQIANSFSQFQKEKKSAVSSVTTEKGKQQVKTEIKTESGSNASKSISKNFAFRLLFGSANPTGKFKSDWEEKAGSNFMISCSYYFTPKVQLGIDFGAQSFKNGVKTVPLMITGRYYTISRKFTNYVSLGLGTAKFTEDGYGKNFITGKIGTGIGYKITKKLSTEMSLDFMSLGSKDEFGYNATSTQFGLGLNYNLAF
ncbi:outer membrane beta-barrel protein [bacterium]|nr:outer membrane beta-barrel protein [bacterium]